MDKSRMMGTAVAMVTIGPASPTREIAVKRAQEYAGKHGYTFIQITETIIPDEDRTPHWNKLYIPTVHPGFERYLILDDDILINTKVAPALPDIPEHKLGLVREPVPPDDFDPPMEWLGNSGVLLVQRGTCDILEKAYEKGVVRGKIPGIADQPAVNIVAWNEGRVEKLNWRWNYILMADWLITAHSQEYPWKTSRLHGRFAKLTLCVCLLCVHGLGWLNLQPFRGVTTRLRQSYFVHLIAFRMGARIVHRVLG